MKCISIWQPFASLIVKGCKVFETRTWAPPASLIGERIGIAATKNIVPGQRAHCADPEFQRYYEALGWPAFDQLPRGVLLGTVLLDSFEVMTEEFMEDVSDEEKKYGWWQVGGYAWRLREPKELPYPIPIRGGQGFFDWRGLDAL